MSGLSRSRTPFSQSFITAYANTVLLTDPASNSVSVSTGRSRRCASRQSPDSTPRGHCELSEWTGPAHARLPSGKESAPPGRSSGRLEPRALGSVVERRRRRNSLRAGGVKPRTLLDRSAAGSVDAGCDTALTASLMFASVTFYAEAQDTRLSEQKRIDGIGPPEPVGGHKLTTECL